MDVTSCCNHAWQNREKEIFSHDAQNDHYSKSKYGKLVLRFFQFKSICLACMTDKQDEIENSEPGICQIPDC